MSFKSALLAGLSAAALALPAFADGIEVHDAYALSASPMAKSGAAFMVIHNHGGPDDHLLSASSPAAAKVELHTHQQNSEGVMKMVHVEEGFDLPKDAEIIMERGGKHVMFLGLTAPFEQGQTIPLTLTFEQAGEVQIDVPVDLERMSKDGHSGHNHSH